MYAVAYRYPQMTRKWTALVEKHMKFIDFLKLKLFVLQAGFQRIFVLQAGFQTIFVSQAGFQTPAAPNAQPLIVASWFSNSGIAPSAEVLMLAC